jgi:hypothetical protein
LPNPKGLPSSLVQLRATVWTGVTRVTRFLVHLTIRSPESG